MTSPRAPWVLGKGVECYGCGDGWTVHEAPDDLGAGPCTISGCPCPGFRWVPRDVVDDAAGYPRRPRPRAMM